MMHFDSKRLLSLAGVVPGHHLREVRELPGFDSWGVDYKPGSWPDVLWIGHGSGDFTPQCYPFMAAHEAMHSIATVYVPLNTYQFFLYNICEDWRVNSCILGIYGELAESYKGLKEVVLRRWQSEPLRLKSPVSLALQHLCYMNHLFTPKTPLPENVNDYLQQMLFLRELFGNEDTWPLVKDDPDRGAINRKVSLGLIERIKQQKAPRNVNLEEIKKLIRRMGYDLADFKSRLAVDDRLEIKRAPAPALAANGTPPPDDPPAPQMGAGPEGPAEAPPREEGNSIHD